MGREGRKGETRLDKKGLESRTRPLSTLFDRRFFFQASHLLITPALWSSNRTGGFKTRRMPGLFCSSRTMKISGTERRFDSPLLRPRGTSDRTVYSIKGFKRERINQPRNGAKVSFEHRRGILLSAFFTFS